MWCTRTAVVPGDGAIPSTDLTNYTQRQGRNWHKSGKSLRPALRVRITSSLIRGDRVRSSFDCYFSCWYSPGHLTKLIRFTFDLENISRRKIFCAHFNRLEVVWFFFSRCRLSQKPCKPYSTHLSIKLLGHYKRIILDLI